MADYFQIPTTGGLTEQQLVDLSIQYSNLKNQMLTEYEAAQAIINTAIAVHQEERRKNSDPGNIQGIG